VLILDAPAAPDGILGNTLHEVFLPFEAYAACLILKAVNGRKAVYRKHHGYRYSDKELVADAAKVGLRVRAVEHMDFETELNRSYVYRHVVKRIPFARKLMLYVGRAIPYVRMFAFQRAA